MDSYEARKLPGTRDAMTPFFSPDGRSIGFFAARELRLLGLDQGSPVTLAQVRRGIGGSWGPDGTIVYGDENAGLFRVPVAGGLPERLTEPDFGDGGYSHVWPSHLPGGSVLFTVWGGTSPGAAALDLATKKWEPVLAAGFGVIVVPTRHVLFSDFKRSLGLLAAPVDERGVPTGAAVAVLEGAQYDRFAGRHFASVSSNGTLVYAPTTDGQAVLEWLDGSGTLTPIRGFETGISSPRLSPAGDRIAFLDRRNNIEILDLRRGSAEMLVPGTLEHQSWNPIWTPDGKSVTFSSNRGGGSWNLYEVTPGGEPRALLVKEYDQSAEAWSPDGQSLVFTEGHPKTGMDLWVLRRGGSPGVLLATPANEFAPALSPDGRWIAYVSDQSGGFQVYVRPFPDGESIVVSTDGGNEPMWSADGRELYFRKGTGLYAASVSKQAGREVSAARLILSRPFDRSTSRERAAYDVASDGRLLVVTNTWNTELRVVFDWFDELKRLVPTDK
jgi:Tol biopolymer transport system component